jgi:hypothetical protein
MEININCIDTEVLYPRLVSFGSLSIGNPDINDDEDSIQPGELPLVFQFPVAEQFIDGSFYPSVSLAGEKYYDILGKIKQYGASLVLYDMPDHVVFFRANFVDELISGDSSTRTISIRFTDDLKSLTKPNEGPPEAGRYKYLSSYIKELMPGIGQVHFITDFRFRYNADNDIYGLQTFCYMHQLGALSNDVYHEKFITKGDILKALLNSFASYGVVSADRDFYVMPMYYNSAEINQLAASSLEGGSEVEYGKLYKALANYYQVNRDGNKDIKYILGKHAKDERARIFNNARWEEDPDIKIITTLFAVGEDTLVFNESDIVKRTWATNLYYLIGEGNPRCLFANKAAYKKADGTYSEEHSLHQWGSRLIFENISGLRRTFKETHPGINYNFYQNYRREGIPAIFRLKNIQYDYENDQSTLLLQECINSDLYEDTAVTVFNKMLRAFDYSVIIKKRNEDVSFRYLETDGDEHSTLPDSPYLSHEEVKIRIKNVYNCRKNNAVEYDGIAIYISDQELNVWIDNWTYVIYIAVGKNKDVTSPASMYPVSDDANAEWFRLASIEDNKINNSGYYYEYTASAKKIQTKNPWWIWVGLKSSSAPLFENIPYYAK